jgi:hypothetical protein
MSIRTIPDNAGTFRVSTARAGNFIVLNDRTGKNQVIMPCRTREQAEEICERLNSGDHNGQINVPY